jgi:hypothetical protein
MGVAILILQEDIYFTLLRYDMKVILKTYIKHIHLILKVYMNGRGDSHLMCVNLFLFDGCDIYIYIYIYILII